jgi:UDP-3-O-[3-hydroxymyristoyl] glucosamine N-acyltransferase
MKNIIIVGSGAVAAELTSYIDDQNKHTGGEDRLDILGYLDLEENIPRYWARYKLKKPVLSNIYDYKAKEGDHFIVGISNIDFREKMMMVLKEKNATISGFIHHTAIIAETAKMGSGNIVYPHCLIGPGADIGNNNFITSYSFISHDCRIGDNNFFATAGLSGNSSIGSNNYFGIRSTVLPNIVIGNKNTIQAGMIVDKNIGDDSIVFHRFKEKVIAAGGLGKNNE